MTGRYLEDFAVAQTFGSGREGCVDSGLVELCDFFAPRKARVESLVLATIVRSVDLCADSILRVRGHYRSVER